MAVTIYGASDDLIEIEGDITDEYPASENGDAIHLSNGFVFSIVYDNDGFWRISALSWPDDVTWTHHAATDIDDDYSDVVTVDGHVTDVVITPIPDRPSQPASN